MMEKKDYLKIVRQEMPKTQHLKTLVRAFIIGGLICIIGQAISDILLAVFPQMSEEVNSQFTIIIIIAITGILTAIGIYDKIGEFGGAGSVIPITGFANSIVSPAIEHKREGYVLGMCSNMFSIAGPVIVFGITASVIVGFIALIFKGLF